MVSAGRRFFRAIWLCCIALLPFLAHFGFVDKTQPNIMTKRSVVKSKMSDRSFSDEIISRLTILRGERSIGEFAEWVGANYRVVARYFTGERRPGIDFLKALAAKGVNVRWLLTGKGEMYSEDEGRQLEFVNVLESRIRGLPESEHEHATKVLLKTLEVIERNQGKPFDPISFASQLIAAVGSLYREERKPEKTQ
jgi:hypothetical protein